MKKYILIVLLIFSFVNISAQSKIGVSFSQNFSTFRFKNSDNKIEDLDYTIKYGYGISFQRDFGKNFFGEGSFSYNNKGASSILDMEKLDWSFHYVNIGINTGYKITIGRLSPEAGAGIYYGRLMKADQLIGSTYYDLMATNNIKKSDFGFNLFAGLEYEYSDNGLVFLRFDESMGLLQLEEGNAVTQKMFNRTFSIQIGLSFNIMKIQAI